jgi:hypothetical protein
MGANAATPIFTPVAESIFTELMLHEKPSWKFYKRSSRDRTDGHGVHIKWCAFASSRTHNKQLSAADKGWSVVLGVGWSVTGPYTQSAYCKSHTWRRYDR